MTKKLPFVHKFSSLQMHVRACVCMHIRVTASPLMPHATLKLMLTHAAMMSALHDILQIVK
jgi:hypothetical protein